MFVAVGIIVRFFKIGRIAALALAGGSSPPGAHRFPVGFGLGVNRTTYPRLTAGRLRPVRSRRSNVLARSQRSATLRADTAAGGGRQRLRRSRADRGR